MSRAAWLTLGAVVVVAAVAYVGLSGKDEQAPKFRKQVVDRGDVVATVSASGSVSAVTTVKIGSQVSGIISALHVDFNSQVTTGQLLAELDPTPFQATVDQRLADLQRSKAELRNADLAFARTKRLFEEKILSQGEYDAAIAQRDAAAASVAQSSAGLEQSRVNLNNTRITSPIDGVVVDRQYDIGQTVAASFQAPTLFTIARDLTKMQVLTNIDEADIGGVKVGQPATFSVDAFPEEPFRGVVSQVRLSPTTVQNVVTYPVVIDVDNSDGRLRPGMTANVTIPVNERKDVLRVPNAALRFKPDPALLVKEEAKAKDEAKAPDAGKGAGRAGGAGPPGRGAGLPARGAGLPARGGSRRMGFVHVEVEGGKLRAIAVRTGITDGAFTACESDELKEGDEVIVGLATAKAMAGTMPGASMGGGMGGGRGPRM